MKKRVQWSLGVLGMAAWSVVAAPASKADEGVVIYRASDHGQAARFKAAEQAAAKPKYSYTQQAYQGTTVYFGEGTNLDPNVYSSRVVSFYVTFDDPTEIHAGHRYGDPEADSRDTRIFPRGRLR